MRNRDYFDPYQAAFDELTLRKTAYQINGIKFYAEISDGSLALVKAARRRVRPSYTVVSSPKYKKGDRKTVGGAVYQLNNNSRWQRVEMNRDSALENDGNQLRNLFGWADQIGNKYQTPEEIEAYQADLGEEVDAVNQLIDGEDADRIGNKYQSDEEIDSFQSQFAAEVEEISDLVDEQFPDDGDGAMDYSRATPAPYTAPTQYLPGSVARFLNPRRMP